MFHALVRKFSKQSIKTLKISAPEDVRLTPAHLRAIMSECGGKLSLPIWVRLYPPPAAYSATCTPPDSVTASTAAPNSASTVCEQQSRRLEGGGKGESPSQQGRGGRGDNSTRRTKGGHEAVERVNEVPFY
jgi:hypothetical protein